MTKNLVVLLIISFSLNFASCQDLESRVVNNADGIFGEFPETMNGSWSGSMEMNGKTVDVLIELKPGAAYFSSYDLMLLNKPVSSLKVSGSKISFSIVLDVSIIFSGVAEDNQIKGTVEVQGGPPNLAISFSLNKLDEIPVKPYTVKKLMIESENVILAGEIYQPKTDKQHPAIVLLHGSSTNLKSDYIFEADYFTKLGFEVLIFDKRGNGESTGDYYASAYNDLINDAIACLEKMKARKSVDNRNIGLWGLSQGALLLPKIITKTSIPSFIIAVSPEIINVTEAAAYSDSLRVVNAGHSAQDGQIVAENHRKVAEMIHKNSHYSKVEDFIQHSVNKWPFMNQTGLNSYLEINKAEYEGFYWKGRTENFQSNWENLSVPALVLFGEKDALVNTRRNKLLLESFRNKHIKTVSFRNANHQLKKVFDPASGTSFDWPRLIEGYDECMKTWIKQVIVE